MKLCVECRFHKLGEPPIVKTDEVTKVGDPPHLCSAILDLVTGEQKDIDCQEARAAPWLCGHEAKLFKYPENRPRLVADANSASGQRLDLTGGHGRDMKPGRSDDIAITQDGIRLPPGVTSIDMKTDG